MKQEKGTIQTTTHHTPKTTRHSIAREYPALYLVVFCVPGNAGQWESVWYYKKFYRKIINTS